MTLVRKSEVWTPGSAAWLSSPLNVGRERVNTWERYKLNPPPPHMVSWTNGPDVLQLRRLIFPSILDTIIDIDERQSKTTRIQHFRISRTCCEHDYLEFASNIFLQFWMRFWIKIKLRCNYISDKISDNSSYQLLKKIWAICRNKRIR